MPLITLTPPATPALNACEKRGLARVLDDEIVRRDTNASGLAAMLRATESSCRGWHEQGKEPRLGWVRDHGRHLSDAGFADLVELLAGDRVRRMAPDARALLLQRLGGGDVVVTPVEQSEVPAHVRPADLADAHQAVEDRMHELRQAKHAVLADNVVTADESDLLFNKRTRLGQAVDWFCRLGHRASTRRVG